MKKKIELLKSLDLEKEDIISLSNETIQKVKGGAADTLESDGCASRVYCTPRPAPKPLPGPCDSGSYVWCSPTSTCSF